MLQAGSAQVSEVRPRERIPRLLQDTKKLSLSMLDCVMKEAGTSNLSARNLEFCIFSGNGFNADRFFIWGKIAKNVHLDH